MKPYIFLLFGRDEEQLPNKYYIFELTFQSALSKVL